MATKSTKKGFDRWRKILHIGQAHLAPGMSLTTWRHILEMHGAWGVSWDQVEDKTIDAIVADISAIVNEARVFSGKTEE